MPACLPCRLPSRPCTLNERGAGHKGPGHLDGGGEVWVEPSGQGREAGGRHHQVSRPAVGAAVRHHEGTVAHCGQAGQAGNAAMGRPAADSTTRAPRRSAACALRWRLRWRRGGAPPQLPGPACCLAPPAPAALTQRALAGGVHTPQRHAHAAGLARAVELLGDAWQQHKGGSA